MNNVKKLTTTSLTGLKMMFSLGKFKECKKVVQGQSKTHEGMEDRSVLQGLIRIVK